MQRFLVLAAALSCAFTAACTSKNSSGGPSDGGGAEVCAPYVSDADLTTPTVSFGSDIIPIMNFSCGISGATCHGNPSVTLLSRPYLGDFDGGTDAQVVHDGLVGIKSNENPSMNYVTATDPAESFLMHKLDWDECTLAADCPDASIEMGLACGGGMPSTSDQLDQPTRDKVRRWIAQGAQNN